MGTTGTLPGEMIGHALGQRVRGQVLADEKTLTRYATDQSIYQIRPLAVVVPQDLDDVVAVVRFAREEGIPLTPRGWDSGTAGAALGRGIILAFGKPGPMNHVLGFDEAEGEPRITRARRPACSTSAACTRLAMRCSTSDRWAWPPSRS